MRQVGTLKDERLAERLADYLLTLEITSVIDEETEGYSLWVHDEQFVDQGREELERFLVNPENARYNGAGRKANEIRRADEQKEKQYAKNKVDLSRQWQRPTAGQFPLTIILIGLCVFITLLTNSDAGRKLQSYLYFAAPTNPSVQPSLSAALAKGEVWRLVTPAFMHSDQSLFHLLFNMYWLFILGRMIETRRGWWRLLLLVLGAAVLSNYAQYRFGDFPGTQWAFLGFSGVNYALFGYCWMKTLFEPGLGIRLQQFTIWIMLGWLVYCMIGGRGDVANAAHVGGLIVGVAVGYAPLLFKRGTA